MNVRVVLGLVLLVAALASGWSLWRNRVAPEEDKAETGRSEYVLRDFELTSLDNTGKEAFTLRAPKLQETPGASTMDLESPLFLLPDKDGNYWEVRSKTGWVSDNREEVRLRGNVDVQSPKGGARPVKMKTEQLNVFPETNLATSDSAVTITQPGLTMQGKGLSANLDTKRFVLKSQVRTRYASTH